MVRQRAKKRLFTSRADMVMAALPSHDATSDDDNEGDDYGQLPIIDTTTCQILIPRLDAPSEPEDDTLDIVKNNDEEIKQNMATFFDVLTDEGIRTIFDDVVLDDCVPEDADEPQESPMAMASTLVSPNAPAIIPLASTLSGFPEAPVVGPSTRSKRQTKVGPLKRRPKKTQKIKKTQFRWKRVALSRGDDLERSLEGYPRFEPFFQEDKDPVDYFQRFFTNDLLEFIVGQSKKFLE